VSIMLPVHGTHNQAFFFQKRRLASVVSDTVTVQVRWRVSIADGHHSGCRLVALPRTGAPGYNESRSGELRWSYKERMSKPRIVFRWSLPLVRTAKSLSLVGIAFFVFSSYDLVSTLFLYFLVRCFPFLSLCTRTFLSSLAVQACVAESSLPSLQLSRLLLFPLAKLGLAFSRMARTPLPLSKSLAQNVSPTEYLNANIRTATNSKH
jgi:hypothetical protein